jgi:hydrogenase maturation protein HypF
MKTDYPDIVAFTVRVTGQVQGVGFRPYVLRLARAYELQGWVKNDGQGARLHLEGRADCVASFINALKSSPPPMRVVRCETEAVDVAHLSSFTIQASDTSMPPTACLTPDMALCPDCLRELFDSTNRRYRYPFINCTHCGPRYSILHRIPYDRAHTTMRDFTMCPACQAEYEDPGDRRFHAQPNACPACGPHLWFEQASGAVTHRRDEALQETVRRLRDGHIIAVKGLGGFHLCVDAFQEEAVLRLRERKRRDEKPFALMFPNLDVLREHCEVSDEEATLLQSTAAPIVLALRKADTLPRCLAPGNPLLGVMLPYTPLHHLLLHDFNAPLVATSGNLSDEPICYDNEDARARLGALADGFLMHNRPIARSVDDSVVRWMAGRPMMLRRARGYAPSPVHTRASTQEPLLAVGGHMKNTVTLLHGSDAIISQHIGDLETLPSQHAFQEAIKMLSGLYHVRPARIACDMHPDYVSTAYAHARDAQVIPVQHHHAHIVSCMEDNGLEGAVLGVAWDGTGYGADGTIWGGEFLRATRSTYQRVGHLRPFRLPGGDHAAREPARAAWGVLVELFGNDALQKTRDMPMFTHFSPKQRDILLHVIAQGTHAPLTTSAGRLFDAAASLLGIRQQCSFEGQAAMELEYVAMQCPASKQKPVKAMVSGSMLDWGPLMLDMCNAFQNGESRAVLAWRFHAWLADALAAIAAQSGNSQIVLSGGCFQNKLLLECAIDALRARGLCPYWHRHVPCNDGGISLGQASVAAERNVCV